jgi:hypothetical protein
MAFKSSFLPFMSMWVVAEEGKVTGGQVIEGAKIELMKGRIENILKSLKRLSKERLLRTGCFKC